MPRLRHALLTIAFCAAAMVAAGQFAQAQSPAQSWPQRPVRFIIPLGPGSGVDITAAAGPTTRRSGASRLSSESPAEVHSLRSGGAQCA